MACVEADDRLVNPLTTRGAVVHVFEFGNMGSQGVGVGEDETGFASTRCSNLDIANNALIGKRDRFPIAFTQDKIGQTVCVPSGRGTQRVNQLV